MGRKKGLVPSPDIIIMVVSIPILLGLVFVVVPLAQRTMGGAISVEVNIKRMYSPLLAENTLSVLLNSEIEGNSTLDSIKYYLYYNGKFKSNGKEVNTTLEDYLEKLIPMQEYLLILNTTQFEKRIYTTNGKDLTRGNSYESKVRFRLPNLQKARVELRLKIPK